MASVKGAGAVLTIDLDAIAANYRLLTGRLGPHSECGAVIKADAYGLGMDAVAPALWASGCRSFFVALAAEGLALRTILPEARIFVFNGADAESARDMAEHGLIPVLNHPGQIADWRNQASVMGRKLEAAIHIDTGMNRLGLGTAETEALVKEPKNLSGLAIGTVMSHLACAEDPGNPLNGRQRARFDKALETLKPLSLVAASLANSSAVFLDRAYHYDLARPGAALFGINPRPAAANPLAQVIKLEGKILQTRIIDTPSTVGYGATHRATPGQRIATVGIGYADGFLRSLSNKAHAFVGSVRVPIVGRVSMDLITLDVTAVAPDAAQPGNFVEIIGQNHTADDLAREAGTIGYEILTALGHRYTRRYVGGAAS